MLSRQRVELARDRTRRAFVVRLCAGDLRRGIVDGSIRATRWAWWFFQRRPIVSAILLALAVTAGSAIVRGGMRHRARFHVSRLEVEAVDHDFSPC